MRSLLSRVAKRALDVAGAGTALVLAAPGIAVPAAARAPPAEPPAQIPHTFSCTFLHFLAQRA